MKKEKDPNSSGFSDAAAHDLKLLSLPERTKRNVHLSSFLETLEECQAVDLMKVLKAAL